MKTLLVFTFKKTKTKMSRRPVLETIFLEKKSHCHMVFAWRVRKLIPGSRSSIGAGLVTVTFEDFLDRGSGDGLDSKFSKLSEDPRVAPAIVLCQFRISFSICSGVRGLPIFFRRADFLADASRIHLRMVPG